MAATNNGGRIAYIANFFFLLLILWLILKPADQSSYVRGLVLGSISSLCTLQSTELNEIDKSVVAELFSRYRDSFNQILKKQGKTIMDIDSNDVFSTAAKKWPDCPTSILLE